MTQPRTIETKGYAKLAVPATFGKLPKLEWLSIGSLIVDPEYQREISSLGRKNIRHHFALEDMWRESTAEAVRIKGSSRLEVLQQKLIKKLSRKLETAK